MKKKRNKDKGEWSGYLSLFFWRGKSFEPTKDLLPHALIFSCKDMICWACMLAYLHSCILACLDKVWLFYWANGLRLSKRRRSYVCNYSVLYCTNAYFMHRKL